MNQQEEEFAYGIKSTISQCVVLTTAYLLNVQQGIDITMPTVINGAMENKNQTDTIESITKAELSWIGSLVYLSPPIGSLCLWLVQSRLGHRMCMAMTNVIQLSCVLVVIIFSNTVSTLYACSMLMGLSTGFATGLSISYSGEVCEPKLRGILASALNVFYFGGSFLVYIANAITNSWKTSLIVTVFVPLVNILVLVVTPDSPMWLLSKGEIDKARKVLRKLRGYVNEEKCALEFQEMVHYVSQSAKSEEANQKISLLSLFTQPEMWSPLKLMLIYIFFSNIMSGVPFTPYLINIIHNFNPSLDSSWVMIFYPACSMFGNILTIMLVHRLGKRFLVLSTITICSFSYLLIGVIGFIEFFGGNFEFSSWAKLLLFFASTFFSSLGIMPIGWILMGEVFPMKSKNVSCSICSAVYFLLSFFMTKFYLDLEALISLNGAFVLFSSMGFGSLVYFYFCMPETENKTLKEVAEYFKPRPKVGSQNSSYF